MSSNKASKQPKLTDKGRVSEELAPISDQPKPVVVDSFRRNAPTPRAPATREQTLSQMTLTQLGAQLPPKALKEIYLAYKDRAVNILDTRIADCDKLIAINNSNDSAAVDDDRTTVMSMSQGSAEAGPSGVPKTPPVKKEKVLSDNPPSSGNKPTTAHNLVDGQEGALWTAFLAVHHELGKELN